MKMQDCYVSMHEIKQDMKKFEACVAEANKTYSFWEELTKANDTQFMILFSKIEKFERQVKQEADADIARSRRVDAARRREGLFKLLQVGPVSVQYFTERHGSTRQDWYADLAWLRRNGIQVKTYNLKSSEFCELV